MTPDEIRTAYDNGEIQPITEAWFLAGPEWSAMIGEHQLTIRRQESGLVAYLDSHRIDLPSDLMMDLTELGTEIELDPKTER